MLQYYLGYLKILHLPQSLAWVLPHWCQRECNHGFCSKCSCDSSCDHVCVKCVYCISSTAEDVICLSSRAYEGDSTGVAAGKLSETLLYFGKVRVCSGPDLVKLLALDYITGKDHLSVMIKYWNCDKLMYTL